MTLHIKKIRDRATRPLSFLLLGVLAIGIVSAVIFYAQGGRSLNIETPSMGQYASVGTTVLTTPVPFNSLQVGDVIAFHPPASGETYFHRIYDIHAGVIETKGDNNVGKDPWQITSTNIIGKEAAKFFGLGYLIKAFPIMLVGGIIVWSVTRFFAGKGWTYWLVPARIAGYGFVLGLSAFITKPFVKAVLLLQTSHKGAETTTLVPTGLFNLHAQALYGTSANMAPGEIGTVVSHQTNAAGYYAVDLSPHIGFWGWVILIVIWSIPAVMSIIYVRRVSERKFLYDDWEDAIIENKARLDASLISA